MNLPKNRRRGALAGLLLLAATSHAQPREPPSLHLSTEGALLEDALKAPCDNRQRLEAVRQLFLAVGAAPEEIFIDSYRRVEDLRVELAGTSEEAILIGAHWDKVSKGCGAVDNWSGIVALAHIFQTLRSIPRDKTLVFVAFGREEEGLVGSKAMAKAIPKPERTKLCAMVNLDSLGLTKPQVGKNLSSRRLTRLARDLAKKMNIPFAEGVIPGNSDSTSFLDLGIPALTIHGLPRDFRKVLHTRNDQVEKIHGRSLYLGYRLALGLVAEIDRSHCTAWQ